ncbi:LRR domain containing protein, partial [Trema orientale]
MYQCISPCNVFQCLESLTLESMLNLEKICHGKLELESFGKLSVISIIDCYELRDVFSASVAKLLLQLEKIEVKNCWKIKDIVTDDGQSIYCERILPKIQSLRLEVVPNLQQFYELISPVETIPAFFNGKLLASFSPLTETVIAGCGSLKYLFLSSAPLNLVQLNTLVIRECWMMEGIIKTNQAMDEVSFPHLTSLTLENLPKLTFIFNDNVTFPSLQRIEIREMDNVEKIWKNPPTLDSYFKLEEIQVVSCKSLRKVLSSDILRRFQNLRKLRIKKCEMLEEVFEMNQNSNVEAIRATPLSHLDLENLPNLKQVWSADPDGSITFENLKTLSTKNCPSLKNLFPVSVTKCLHQLEDIFVKDCGIQEIVGKEEKFQKMGPELFVLPKLTKMHLELLPQLVSFYRGPHTFKWPSLKSLEVIECAKVSKVFGLEFSSALEVSNEDQHLDIPIQQDALFSLDK